MAEIDFSPVLGDAKGHAGNIVFTSIGLKKIIKQKGKKKNHHTKPRERTEDLFDNLSQVWKGMERHEKATWEKLVKSPIIFKLAAPYLNGVTHGTNRKTW